MLGYWTKAEYPPVQKVEVLGWDCFYNRYHICVYRGNTTDDGSPLLEPVSGEDDCLISHWTSLLAPPKDATPPAPSQGQTKDYDCIECDKCHGTGNFPIVKDGRGEFETCEKCFGHGDILPKRDAKPPPPP